MTIYIKSHNGPIAMECNEAEVVCCLTKCLTNNKYNKKGALDFSEHLGNRGNCGSL